MTKQKIKQTTQKIKADLKEGQYSLKRISERERNPSRAKRLKKI